jgi:hypothetical protein
MLWEVILPDLDERYLYLNEYGGSHSQIKLTIYQILYPGEMFIRPEMNIRLMGMNETITVQEMFALRNGPLIMRR